MTDDQRLELIAPVFQFVGINAKRVFEIGMMTPEKANANGGRKRLMNLKSFEDHFRTRIAKAQASRDKANNSSQKKSKVKQKPNSSLRSKGKSKRV